MFKDLRKDNEGFTLTEVMIGIMILTMAIVSASNVLMGVIKSNQYNLTSMQAYYFAQEGLEAVRSMRDTNWIHSQDWLGKDGGVYTIALEEEDGFSVNLRREGWEKEGYPAHKGFLGLDDISGLASYYPWNVGDNFDIKKCDDSETIYFGSDCETETIFERTIKVEKYDCNFEEDQVEGCDKNLSVLLTSTVQWNIGSDERELSLSTVLTDWRSGDL